MQKVNLSDAQIEEITVNLIWASKLMATLIHSVNATPEWKELHGKIQRVIYLWERGGSTGVTQETISTIKFLIASAALAKRAAVENNVSRIIAKMVDPETWTAPAAVDCTPDGQIPIPSNPPNSDSGNAG